MTKKKLPSTAEMAFDIERVLAPFLEEARAAHAAGKTLKPTTEALPYIDGILWVVDKEPAEGLDGSAIKRLRLHLLQGISSGKVPTLNTAALSVILKVAEVVSARGLELPPAPEGHA